MRPTPNFANPMLLNFRLTKTSKPKTITGASHTCMHLLRACPYQQAIRRRLSIGRSVGRSSRSIPWRVRSSFCSGSTAVGPEVGLVRLVCLRPNPKNSCKMARRRQHEGGNQPTHDGDGFFKKDISRETAAFLQCHVAAPQIPFKSGIQGPNKKKRARMNKWVIAFNADIFEKWLRVGVSLLCRRLLRSSSSSVARVSLTSVCAFFGTSSRPPIRQSQRQASTGAIGLIGSH